MSETRALRLHVTLLRLSLLATLGAGGTFGAYVAKHDVVMIITWGLVATLLSYVIMPYLVDRVTTMRLALDVCPGCSAPDAEPCRPWCR